MNNKKEKIYNFNKAMLSSTLKIDEKKIELLLKECTYLIEEFFVNSIKVKVDENFIINFNYKIHGILQNPKKKIINNKLYQGTLQDAENMKEEILELSRKKFSTIKIKNIILKKYYILLELSFIDLIIDKYR